MRRFEVTGMSCAACAARVEKAAGAVEGVESCAVNLLMNELGVEGSADSAEIIAAVESVGYGCRENNGESEKEEDPFRDRETPKLFTRFCLSLGLLGLLLLFMKKGMKLPQILLCLAVMGINCRFFINGIKGAVRLSPNMDTLVSMGSLAAFIYGYYDSAAMILTLITIGKTLEARSKGKTTNAIKALVSMSPKTATLIRNGAEITVGVERLALGDRFLVYPGNAFPVDGIVEEGESFADESMLTGESELIKKSPGSPVSAGTINKSKRLLCTATALGEDTTLSRIIRLVSDTAATKAPIARLADKVSAVFVPAVMGIALVTFAAWLLLGEDVGFALARGISVLVISCPCALGLATPVAIMVSTGKGARNGILFKNAAAIEETGRISALAFDKTGTLTFGSRAVTDVKSLEALSAEESALANTLRPDAKSCINQLKAMGMRVFMISGDRKEKAEAIATECGIENVVSEVLPGEKNEAVKKIQAGGSVKTAMVGDGINDAPALTQADVGIALGSGTDVAIDSADIVILRSDLTAVADAVKLSKATLKNIRQNLFWAFFYNAIGIPVAAGVFASKGILLSPSLGAACMSLSSFCVVTNALRLNLIKLNGKNENITKEIKEEPKEMEKTFKVSGMMCPHCEARVKAAVEAVPGVVSALPSHSEGSLKVCCEGLVEDEKIIAAVTAAGYEVL